MAELGALPRSLWLLVAGTTITRAGAFVFPYLTLYLGQERGLPLDVVGMVLAVGSVGLVGGNFLGGWAADRIGRKSTLLAALSINALGFLALGQPAATPASYAAWLLVGYVGSGMYGPAAAALIADETPEHRRPLAYTVNYMGANLGMAVGPLVGGLVAQASFGWLFIGDALTTMACALVIALGVHPRPAPRRERKRLARSGHCGLWRAHPGVLAFVGASFFLVAPLMGLEYAVPLLVARTFEADLVWVGVIYTINAGMILGSSVVVERWSRGRDEVRVMVVAAALWASGLLVLALCTSLWALVGCTVIWTLGEVVASIAVPSYVAARVPRHGKGRMMALADVVRSAAGMAAPLVLGVIWQGSGVDAVLTILVVLPLVGGALYLFLAGAGNRGR
ncbi:MAG: MFS transporter [Nannocystaceae bacterium]